MSNRTFILWYQEHPNVHFGPIDKEITLTVLRA
jgi:hypothetical protein